MRAANLPSSMLPISDLLALANRTSRSTANGAERCTSEAWGVHQDWP